MDPVRFDKNLDTIVGLGPAAVAGNDAADKRAEHEQANEKRKPTRGRTNCRAKIVDAEKFQMQPISNLI